MKTFIASVKPLIALCLFVALVAAQSPVMAEPGTQTATAAEVSVNINTASAEELSRELVGVGPSKADAIVRYREANGSFGSVEELLEVKGIGQATLDKNRDKLQL